MNKKHHTSIFPICIIICICSLGQFVNTTFLESDATLFASHMKAFNTKLREPSPPRNLEAITTNKKIILIWNAPASNKTYAVSEYTVYRRYDYSSYSVIARLNSSALSFVDSNLSQNINSYNYTVTARNTIGESKKSNIVLAFPFDDSIKFSE